MKIRIDIENQQINYTFDELEPVILNVPKLSDDVLEYAQYHGLMSNTRDAAALSRKQPDGSIITITEAMRRDAIKARVDYLESGATEWERKGGKRAPTQNPTIAKIAERMGCTYAEAEAEVARKMLDDMAA